MQQYGIYSMINQLLLRSFYEIYKHYWFQLNSEDGFDLCRIHNHLTNVLSLSFSRLHLTWSITPLPVFSVLWQLLLLLVFETLIPVQAICCSAVTAWQGSRVNWGNTALTELLLTVVVTIYAEVSLWNPRSWRRGARWCKLVAHQRETPAPEAGVGAQEADETLAHLASLTKQPLPLWCRRRRQDNHTPLYVVDRLNQQIQKTWHVAFGVV